MNKNFACLCVLATVLSGLVISKVGSASDPDSVSVTELLRGRREVDFRIKDKPDFVDIGDRTEFGIRICTKDRTSATIWLIPPAQQGHWDFSDFSYFRLDFDNNTDGLTHIKVRLDCSDEAKDWKDSASSQTFLLGKEQQTLGIAYPRPSSKYDGPVEFKTQSSKPNGHRTHWKSFNPEWVKRIKIDIQSESTSIDLVLQRIQLSFPYQVPQTKALEALPYLDRLGQVRCLDWPGKQSSLNAISTSAGDQLPRSANLNQWGGWKTGPALKSTGFFRTEKHNGKWWFVDPSGRLFLSHGCNSVGFRGSTPWTEDKAQLFAWVPRKGEPIFDAMFSVDRNENPLVSFYRGNLFRKYGDGWQKLAAEHAHQRFHAWGLNTMGAWSDDAITSLRKTPYTPVVHLWGPFLESGSIPASQKVPDPFADGFSQRCHERFTELKSRIGDDPWCLGIFVDNEIHWSDEIVPAVLGLGSWSNAKQNLVSELKYKYKNIKRLNEAWKCEFESWQALTNNHSFLKRTKTRTKDFDQLLKHYSDQYYRVCREQLKIVFPNHLYMGSRIHTCPWSVSHSAAKYVDVYSVNHYWFEAGVGTMPNHIDKPVLITEFHFGSLDAGVPGPSLVPVHNQLQRARSYAHYVSAGLMNPRIVGTHWFAYVDQNPLGRPGENYNIGLVDVTDQPYAEMVKSLRSVSELQYQMRNSSPSYPLRVSHKILRNRQAIRR